MTATGVDRINVHAPDARDAEDVAKRRWETFGFRVLRIVESRRASDWMQEMDGLPRWTVWAEIEVVRP